MKRKIYRILSVLMCIQMLFGLLPVSDLHLHDDDHDHGQGGLLVTTARAWEEESTCPAMKKITVRAAETVSEKTVSAHAERAVRTAPSSAIAAGAVRNAAISALAAEDAISATTTYAATVMRRVICAAGSARAV